MFTANAPLARPATVRVRASWYPGDRIPRITALPRYPPPVASTASATGQGNVATGPPVSSAVANRAWARLCHPPTIAAARADALIRRQPHAARISAPTVYPATQAAPLTPSVAPTHTATARPVLPRRPTAWHAATISSVPAACVLTATAATPGVPVLARAATLRARKVLVRAGR